MERGDGTQFSPNATHGCNISCIPLKSWQSNKRGRCIEIELCGALVGARQMKKNEPMQMQLVVVRKDERGNTYELPFNLEEAFDEWLQLHDDTKFDENDEIYRHFLKYRK